MEPYRLAIDFHSGQVPVLPFTVFDRIIEDRGSRYSVAFGMVHNLESIAFFISTLKKKKRFAKATHHSYAARIQQAGAIYQTKSDDGEAGAGMVIMRILEQAEAINTIVSVTRWYGGVKLGNDRFKHIQSATKHVFTHGEWKPVSVNNLDNID